MKMNDVAVTVNYKDLLSMDQAFLGDVAGTGGGKQDDTVGRRAERRGIERRGQYEKHEVWGYNLRGVYWNVCMSRA